MEYKSYQFAKVSEFAMLLCQESSTQSMACLQVDSKQARLKQVSLNKSQQYLDQNLH